MADLSSALQQVYDSSETALDPGKDTEQSTGDIASTAPSDGSENGSEASWTETGTDAASALPEQPETGVIHDEQPSPPPEDTWADGSLYTADSLSAPSDGESTASDESADDAAHLTPVQQEHLGIPGNDTLSRADEQPDEATSWQGPSDDLLVAPLEGQTETATAPLSAPQDFGDQGWEQASSGAQAVSPSVLDEAAPVDAEPSVSTNDTIPNWASTESLDRAFANWAPGPPEDAPAAERAFAQGVSTDYEGPDAQLAQDDPSYAAPYEVEPIEGLIDDSSQEPEEASDQARVGWQRSDDDILPRRGLRSRLYGLTRRGGPLS